MGAHDNQRTSVGKVCVCMRSVGKKASTSTCKESVPRFCVAGLQTGLALTMKEKYKMENVEGTRLVEND